MAVYRLACILIVDPVEVTGQSHMASIALYTLSLYHIVGQKRSLSANYQIAGIEIGIPGDATGAG